jgi:hypothetical protein
MITYLELGITDGVSVRLVSIYVRRLTGDTLNITCNFLHRNQVHRDILVTLYLLKQRKDEHERRVRNVVL